MILITGATGQLGKEVINQLLKKTNSSNLAVLVREASKVEDLKTKGVDIRIGNYDDYNSLVSVFSGIDKLYFVSGNDISKRTQQHENVVKAAKKAGVKHILYTSFQRRNDTETSPIAMIAESHIKAENWIKESGMNYTILKHGLYMDMLPVFIGDKVLQTGTIYQPAGEGKTAYTLRKDMAEVAANILSSEGHENKTYDIVANQAYSYHEIAKIISSITGTLVNYVSPSPQEYIKTLSEAGFPVEHAGMFAGFGEAIKQGEFAETSNELESLLGRKSTPITDYLTQIYSSKN